ncbi:MAG: MFS transporter [Acetobacteraceae bacterium]|nr:MFS transporter [Acetobacteraceae bacterium]
MSVRSPFRRGRPATPNGVLAIVCVAICLANLDLFIVNVALPDMARSLGGAALDAMSWVLNGYAIAYAALLVFFGRLAERHRRDLSFLWGVGLFTLASAACAAADSVPMLVGFRVVQAAGAALMTPTSLGLLLASFPPDRRAGAVRVWTALGGFAAALGPLLGGALLTLSWRWIFLVNVPAGLIAIAIGLWKLPRVPGHDAPRPNAAAALLVTLGIAALVLAIVKGNDWGWSSAATGGSVLVAALCLALFVRHCLRSANPFVDPALFRNRRFTGATLVMAPYSVAFGGMLLSVALWEQSAWHWSALQTGLAIAPGPLLVPITSLLFGGRLLRRFGAAAVLTAGICCFMDGLILYALGLGLAANGALAALGMVPTGIGVGLTFPTLMGVGTSALPAASLATGSGVINMTRQAALAVGVAIFVAIVGPARDASERLAAFDLGWWVLAAIIALGLLPVALLLRQKPRRLPAGAAAFARVETVEGAR